MTPDPKPFRFKQFKIHQHQCAMKVGTDGVLLGAWTNPTACESILDIGTGTGLLALMLAQKSNAQIDAVEIEPKAAEQARYNCEQSKWKKRITVYEQAIQNFQDSIDKQYDLIVSNPPYFSKQPSENSRNIARSQNSLRFKELIEISAHLLHNQGKFCLVIPLEAAAEFITESNQKGLYLQAQCKVKGNFNSPAKRILLCFSKKASDFIREEELVLEKDQRHSYTQEYLELVEPFLL